MKLGQLDLNLAFPCSRALREDIENELRAVDHLDVQAEDFAEVAALRGREIVVEDHDVGRRVAAARGEFLGFAAANKSGGGRGVAFLADEIKDFRAGGHRQLAKFFEGIFHRPLVVAGSLQSNEERSLAQRLLRVVHLQRAKLFSC